MTEPENLVLILLREMRAEMATKSDLAKLEAKIGDVRSEVHSLRADVASDLMTLEKRLEERIVGLRRAVMEYHSSAIGHGVLISELEERVLRIERRLDLAPPETH
ncbi:MAG: hypothetical protein ACLPN5_11015 [Roseiarcus sp.]